MFEEYLNDPDNSLVEAAIDEGRIPIGYTCSLVPDVLLSIPPLFPIRMSAPGVTGTEIADIYLSTLTCSYVRSLMEFAMDGRYDFLGGWVHAVSCDHLRRLHDNMEYVIKPDFSYILDIPHRASEEALAWYIDDLLAFIQKLEEHFGIHITDDAIRKAIQDKNNFLQMLSLIGEMRKRDAPPFSGTEFHKLMIAAITSPREMIEKPIMDFKNSLPEKEGNNACRARLMVVGGQLDDYHYIEAIESTGALVVADRICTGSIPGLEQIKVGDNPLMDIARHTLTTPCCPRMMDDFDKRVEQIISVANEYKVEGIIIEVIKFCDTWGVESAELQTILRDAGFKVLPLEREYSRTAEGQLQTRVQAFLESMGK